MDENELLKIAIKDLVTLAIKSNNVILTGQFPGHIADDVKEVLDMCKHIHNTFVEVENGK